VGRIVTRLTIGFEMDYAIYKHFVRMFPDNWIGRATAFVIVATVNLTAICLLAGIATAFIYGPDQFITTMVDNYAT
jgi:hypothetical protein